MTPPLENVPDTRDLYVGRILDEKYRLERLLGRGGMGAVYLSTHLGTGRTVAVKLITPEFMRDPECVERFKREARAAGRLRHPNIVDVTDFGVTHLNEASIAYLVMEYLDGCTLSQVLQEQKRVPLHWAVNILEQACAAIHKAHEQGIIHRDLKPANIWLEPNTLGGFRVKVLDFGIAKLAEEQDSQSAATKGPPIIPQSAISDSERTLLDPIVGPAGSGHSAEPSPHTVHAASRGLSKLQSSPPALPQATMMQIPPETVPSTEALTRVGAILGTPLFMSPEQCRGEPLDPRSDLYSIGVIAYQMLAGTTPFTGDTATILRAHQQSLPIPLWKQGAKTPRPVAQLIMSALEKNPAARPQNALAFAHALRASSETLGVLCRRAFALYSEYFPKVVALSFLAHIPTILFALILIALPLEHHDLAKSHKSQLEAVIGSLKSLANFIAGSTIAGVVAIVVAQVAVAPLRPVSLRPAFSVLRKRWLPFLKTGIAATARIYLGYLAAIVPGVFMMTRYSLWAPVALLERLEGKAALRRARALAARSRATSLFAALFQLSVAAVVPWAIHRILSPSATHVQTLKERTMSELSSLSSILFMPLVSIVLALIYLKMRQLGGESPAALESDTFKVGAPEHPTRLLREESTFS